MRVGISAILVIDKRHRMLLTRARDGMILYLSDNEFNSETRQHLFECGIEDLTEVDSSQ